jgi:hypothetical protein
LSCPASGLYFILLGNLEMIDGFCHFLANVFVLNNVDTSMQV